jgi:hypothetical protein
MDLIYKTLFEVKLMHEYFLTKEDGTNLFGEPDPLKRLDLLDQLFAMDRPAMDTDIGFDFPESLRSTMQNYGLKVVPSYGGCRVFIRVNRIILADQSVVYEPFYPIPDPTEIFILFIKKNNLPDIYSNERIARSIPALYTFSNENIPDARQFPFLVNFISPFDAGFFYEQGQMAIDSSSKLQEYFYDGAGTLKPTPITASVQSFANENDRMLLPLSFYYRPTGKNPVTQLDITLNDSSSNPVKTFSFSQTEPIDKVFLDFSDKAARLILSDTVSLPAGIFSLQATGNNGYSEDKNIIFSNNCYSISNWGMAYFKTRVTNPQFNLIADDGYLIKRQDGAGNLTEAPVFEIPVKSRYGNFRYTNSNGKELKLNPVLNNFLVKEDKALISLLPVPLCKYYFLVPETGGGPTKYLPNPKSYDIKKDKFQRIFFDIPVPESDLFPVVP